LDLKLNYRTEIHMSINSSGFTKTTWRTKIQQNGIFYLWIVCKNSINLRISKNNSNL